MPSGNRKPRKLQGRNKVSASAKDTQSLNQLLTKLGVKRAEIGENERKLARKQSLRLALNPKTARYLRHKQLVEAARRLGFEVDDSDSTAKIRKMLVEEAARLEQSETDDLLDRAR